MWLKLTAAVVKKLVLRVEHESVGVVMMMLLMLMGWSVTVCSSFKHFGLLPVFPLCNFSPGANGDSAGYDSAAFHQLFKVCSDPARAFSENHQSDFLGANPVFFAT